MERGGHVIRGRRCALPTAMIVQPFRLYQGMTRKPPEVSRSPQQLRRLGDVGRDGYADSGFRQAVEKVQPACVAPASCRWNHGMTTIGLTVGGIILCGGRGRRIGADKAWLRFGDEPRGVHRAIRVD